MKTAILCFLFLVNAPLTFAHIVNSRTLDPDLVVPAACAPYVALIEKYNWNVQTAINVMNNESSCEANAVNLNDKHKSDIYPRDYPQGYCMGSFGLFQTSCTRIVYYDAAENIALAYQIYREQGWHAWLMTCTTKVKCYN